MRLRGILFILAVGAWLLPPGSVFSDVIAYWRFEENGGDYASDSAGSFDGILSGFSNTSSNWGNANENGWSSYVPSSTIPLTGDENHGSLHMGCGYVDFSQSYTLSLGTSFTVECYLKITDLYPNSILGLGADYGTSKLFLYMSEYMGNAVFNYSLEDQGFYTIVSDFTTNEWHHYAFVKEPGSCRLYLDGTLLTTMALSSDLDGPYVFPAGWPGDRTIGNESGALYGWLDEVRISDEALTPDQFLCAIPEPSSLMFFSVGLWLLFHHRRKRV